MAVDLREVAERSEVSISTASRALAGSPRVSEQTRLRVLATARELGYRPNANARALRTARSQLVGLVITNLVNAGFRVIAEVVQRRLAEVGLQMVLSVTDGDPAQERAALHTLADHNAVGVIVVGSDLQATAELNQAGIAIVHLARRPQVPGGDCVLGDDLAGAREATRYLLGLGHRRIAIVSGPLDVTSGRERLGGYRLAMAEAHRRVDTALVISGRFVPQTGADAVERLLGLPAARRPTAILVANHEAAWGVLPVLQERGVSVPDDMSVVCYEDAELMRWWHPAVTVVDNNATQIGELAARMLIERIQGHGRQPADGEQFGEFRVGAKLVLRDSCAAPPS